MRVPLGTSDYNRRVPKEAQIKVRNRFFEENPVLNPDQGSLIARPGFRLLTTINPDEGVRGIYSCPGTFGDVAFVVIGNSLYKLDSSGTLTLAGFLPSEKGPVSFAAVANIGDENPEKLFIADGGALSFYVEDGYAQGTLTTTGTRVAGEVVRVGDMYYSFDTGSLDTGAPDGTSGNPWKVLIGVTESLTFANLFGAINNSGLAGTDYSTDLTPNTDVRATFKSTDTLIVAAILPGAGGNSFVTTETGADLAWASGTLTGGGLESIVQVETPDDVGIISVGAINSYVICVPAQGEGVNGRFYWIQPGETTIDPLDFATAERSPDPIYEVVIFGDQFWLPGQTTTEVWYMTGDLDSPVSPLKGVVFDRGAWQGTALQIKDSMMIVDSDGAVLQIQGGLKRVSTPDIEERIRKAIAFETIRT